MSEKIQYVCPKCGNKHYESDQFQATGGNFAKMRLYGAVQSEHRRGMECSGFPAGIRGRSFSDDERIFLKTYNVYGIYMNIGWSEHL